MLVNNVISNLRRVFLFVLIMVGILVIAGCDTKSEELVSDELVSIEEVSEDGISEDAVIEEVASEEVVTIFIDAINSKDADSTTALLSEDVVLTFGKQGTYTGRNAVQIWLKDMFIKNLKIDVNEVEVVNGNIMMQNSVTMIGLQDWHIDALTGVTEVTVDDGQISGYNFHLDEPSLAKWPVAVSSVDEIIGAWMGAKAHPGPGVIFLQFNLDGTYRQTTGSAERLETRPLVEGTYEFVDGQVLITDETMWVENKYLGGYCDIGSEMIGTYNALWLANGNMRLEVVHEECIGRDKILMWEYEFVQ